MKGLVGWGRQAARLQPAGGGEEDSSPPGGVCVCVCVCDSFDELIISLLPPLLTLCIVRFSQTLTKKR